MQPELNPFAPGSGLHPPALTGRSDEIAAFDLTVARTRARRSSRGMILHGLRGVGKTVLLNSFVGQAENADWFVVRVEGQPTKYGKEALRQKLGRELLKAASKLSRSRSLTDRARTALGTVKSVSLSLGVAAVNIGIEPTPGRGDSGKLEIDFEEMVDDLAPALRDSGLAFAIFIDEMQDIDEELLISLLAAQHRAGQKGDPFYIFGAGLPDLPARLSRARSYAERLFDYRRIGPLDAEAAEGALVQPVTKYGARFAETALQQLLECANGYPYFLQTFGRAAWDAGRNRLIDDDDAEAAITIGYWELDMGFYPSRWERATPKERSYMRAMASLGDENYSTGDIVRSLHSSLSGQSKVRQGLIDKGIVFAPDRGRLSFTVPGMAAYIRRQFDD